MKMSHLMAVFAACAAASLVCMSLIGGPALAQRPGMPQVSSTAVLLDVQYVFKHHDGFRAESDQVKADAQRLQAQFKTDGEEIRKFQEKLADFRPGTPDYKAAQEEFTHRVSDFQTRQTMAKQDLELREAQVFNRVYQEVQQEVEYYCANNNVALVLQFNGDPINPDKPADIGRMVTQQVVYHAKSIDITPIILQSIRARHGWTDGPRNATLPPPAGVNPTR